MHILKSAKGRGDDARRQDMISYAEQELLETIVKNTSRSLQDIYTVLGKVYDDELALDLNIQAARLFRDQRKGGKLSV